MISAEEARRNVDKFNSRISPEQQFKEIEQDIRDRSKEGLTLACAGKLHENVFSTLMDNGFKVAEYPPPFGEGTGE